MRKSDDVWTADTIRRFTELHANPEGFSFAQLSAMMSAYCGKEISRNACIGKARRLGLPERSGKVRAAPLREGRKVIKPRIDAPIPPPIEAEPEPVVGVSIYQLANGVCRWPLGKMEDRPPYRYCGGAAEEVYCTKHSQISYNRPRF